MLAIRFRPSTPVRIALIFASLFTTLSALAATAAYLLVVRELQQTQIDNIRDIYQLVAETYDESDPSKIVAVVEAHAISSRNFGSVILLENAGGRKLAGNADIPDLRIGWSQVSGAKINADPELNYHLLEGYVGDLRLVVGLSDEDIDDFREITFASLAWTSLASIVFAIIGGAALANAVRKRLLAVRETINRVAAGDLGARIPLGGGGDIDELMRASNEALDRLQYAVQAIGHMSTGIAHELRTPLNRLRILLEGAITSAKKGRSGTRALNEAMAECRNIDETFRALVGLAQIEAGQKRERFRPTDLAAVLGAVFEAYEEVAEDAKMKLVFTPLAPGMAVINGEPNLLTQLFANLVENAIRHCPRGTSIEIELAHRGDRVVVGVSDDGPGIPLEEREKVFERLYRLEKSRTTPGAGLGLAIAKAIATQHGGTIRVEDNPRRRSGARFIVEFAAAQAVQ